MSSEINQNETPVKQTQESQCLSDKVDALIGGGVNEREKVRLIHITKDAEVVIAYCARVSNPDNQENRNIEKLLNWCAEHGHWSIFEMANMCVEINTERDISAQILRHKSMSFQEFSGRYQKVLGVTDPRQRRQDAKNKQSSHDDLPLEEQEWFEKEWQEIKSKSLSLYGQALEKGFAKETARRILPMSTQTRIYVNGSVRSWIHYLKSRCAWDAQGEHQEVAEMCRAIFAEQMPVVARAAGLLW